MQSGPGRSGKQPSGILGQGTAFAGGFDDARPDWQYGSSQGAVGVFIEADGQLVDKQLLQL